MGVVSAGDHSSASVVCLVDVENKNKIQIKTELITITKRCSMFVEASKT